MTTSATTVSAAATYTKAPWMRANVLNMALAQGFTWEQISTQADRFTKGTTVVEVAWTSEVVASALHHKGGKLAKQLPSGAAGKLQHITTWLGHKSMTPAQKWTSSDLVKVDQGKKVRSSKDELVEQAATTFKVMASK